MLLYTNYDAIKALQNRIAEDFTDTPVRRGLRLAAVSDHAAK